MLSIVDFKPPLHYNFVMFTLYYEGSATQPNPALLESDVNFPSAPRDPKISLDKFFTGNKNSQMSRLPTDIRYMAYDFLSPLTIATFLNAIDENFAKNHRSILLERPIPPSELSATMDFLFPIRRTPNSHITHTPNSQNWISEIFRRVCALFEDEAAIKKSEAAIEKSIALENDRELELRSIAIETFVLQRIFGSVENAQSLPLYAGSLENDMLQGKLASSMSAPCMRCELNLQYYKLKIYLFRTRNDLGKETVEIIINQNGCGLNPYGSNWTTHARQKYGFLNPATLDGHPSPEHTDEIALEYETIPCNLVCTNFIAFNTLNLFNELFTLGQTKSGTIFLY